MAESISKPQADNPAKGAVEESNLKPKSRQLFWFARRSSKSESRKLYEEAVENAQYVMAYASSKCKKEIDGDTVEKLIIAKRRIENNELASPKEESEFWIAYQDLWNLVRPLTAECIRATEGPKARKTMYWHIGFTFLVLFVLLVLQIYWVIGNQLTTKLTDLLQRENELSEEVSANREEYAAIELRYKQNETDSDNFKGYYEFMYTPEFERDTAENLAIQAKLETQVASLGSELERNRAILLAWSGPWFWLIKPSLTQQEVDIENEIKSNNDQIQAINQLLTPNPAGQTPIQIARMEIEKFEKELNDLNKDPVANETRIIAVTTNLDKARSDYEYFNQLEQQLQSLKDANNSLSVQKISKSIQEKSRQAQLAALFVLIILQSYLLPLLYGLLGASSSSLRSLSREIDQVIFSEKRRIQHMLRIALGALSGIMVGWFSFLYEGTTLLGSVPPLAIAFLVGYNIDLFFSLMDRGIDAIKRGSRPASEQDNSTRGTSNPAKDKVQKDEQTESAQEASSPVG